MHRRFRGLGSTVAFLFVGYAVAWFSDSNEINSVVGKPDAVTRALEALGIASVFVSGVLHIIVWPQTLLTNWLVARSRVHHIFPFALFFGMSSIVVCVLNFTVFDNERLVAYLMCTGYLVVACSIFWSISFRRPDTAPKPPAAANSVSG